MIEPTTDNVTYATVKAINGPVFANMWNKGKASPDCSEKFPWMVVTLNSGTHKALWFDTEHSAKEFIDAHGFSFNPYYLAKTVAVRKSHTETRWKEMLAE